MKDLQKYKTILTDIKCSCVDNLPHRSNLLQKLINTENNKRGSFLVNEDISLFLDPYIRYITKLMDLIDKRPSRGKREEMFDLYREYQSFIRVLNKTHLGNNKEYFSSQSKYEPTIIEEFLILFFRDLIEDNLRVGSVKIKSSSKERPIYDHKASKWTSKEYTEKKDQDVAIYFEEDGKQTIIMAAEVKSSYIDKTMTNGTTNTFKDIHKENPLAMTMIITEAVTIDPEYIFEEGVFVYCLKKIGFRDHKSEYDYDFEVFNKMYNDVSNHILSLKDDSLTHHEKLMTRGYIY